MLADLDELALRCRDDRAKAYISEALACYKAGANRSAIIATWIAVMFDIIDKLRELALTGDKAAVEATERFDAITAANDIAGAQRFERELLTLARDKFELISPQEYIDLERLQEDRHRCAHPSQSSIGEVFSPPAELARFHIRNAVEHLLQQEPAQGKTALDGILATIGSSYFPLDEKKALAVLSGSPLKRARASLVRNLTVVLLKALLREDPGYPTTSQRRVALNCIRVLHPAEFIRVLQKNLTALIRGLGTDEELLRAAQLVYFDSSFADVVEEDQLVRLSEFIQRLPSGQLAWLEDFLRPGPFLDAARRRTRRLSLEEVIEVSDMAFGGAIPSEVCDRIVECYAGATSFDSANEWGKRSQANLESFSVEQTKTILRAALTNNQIRGSFQLPHVVAAIKKDKKYQDGEVAALVAEIEALPDLW